MTWRHRDTSSWLAATPGIAGATTGRRFAPTKVSVNSALMTGTYFQWDNPQYLLDNYSSWLQRPLDYALIFTEGRIQAGQTADPYDHLALPSYIRARHEQNPGLGLWMGKSLVMRQKDGSTNGGDWGPEMSWQQLSTGSLDKTWLLQAQRIRDLQDMAPGRPVPRLRTAHELDLSIWYYYPQTTAEVGYMKDAYQRYYDIVKPVVPEAIIEFNPVSSAGIGGHRTFSSIVPADSAYDCLAVDTYDMAYNDWGWALQTGTPPTDTMRQAMWQQFLGDANTGRGLNYLRAQAVARGKSMSFPEVGTGMYQFKGSNPQLNVSGGDNPYYVNGLADFIFDPAYPAGSGQPGSVDAFAWWEDGAHNGSPNGVAPRHILRPTSWTSADDGRKVSRDGYTYNFSMSRSRAAFEERFITQMNGA